MRAISAVLALALLTLPPVVHARGVFRGGAFVPGQAMAQAPANGVYQWITREDTPDQVYLFKGNQQVGGYHYGTGFYRSFDGRNWGGTTRAPITPPFNAVGQAPQRVFFGADTSKLAGRSRYLVGGAEVGVEAAYDLIGAPVPDDSKAPHVTVIVPDNAARIAALKDWDRVAASNPAAKDTRFQAYAANEPVNQLILEPNKLAQDEAFRRAGAMVTTQQAAKGSEAGVQADRTYGYRGPSDLTEALRKAHPEYDPNRSPVPNLPGLASVPAEIWIGVGLVILCLFLFVRKS